MTDLVDRFDLGSLALPNRVAMSAMTRTCATDDDVPTDLMLDYYVQRASTGLIITECIQVSDTAHGTIRGPGLHRPDQIAARRKITDAVHTAGGRIYVQTWHRGSITHPEMRDGKEPVGPSPIPVTGDFFLPTGQVEFPTPRELSIEEIISIIADFAQATHRAREAGIGGEDGRQSSTRQCNTGPCRRLCSLGLDRPRFDWRQYLGLERSTTLSSHVMRCPPPHGSTSPGRKPKTRASLLRRRRRATAPPDSRRRGRDPAR